VTGEKSGQAGWPGSSEVGSQGLMRRQNSPVPLAVFAHRQMRMRDLAARGDKKLLRAGSSSSGRFSSLGESQLPRGYPVATAHQHGRATLAVTQKNGISQKKDAERRDKMSVRTGKDTTARQAA